MNIYPKQKKRLYPGIEEAEKERVRVQAELEEEPDMMGLAPNYDKFRGVDPERVLVWLNID